MQTVFLKSRVVAYVDMEQARCQAHDLHIISEAYQLIVPDILCLQTYGMSGVSLEAAAGADILLAIGSGVGPCCRWGHV